MLLLSTIYYILFIETEKYESKMIILIKDLSQEQTVSPFGSLLSAGSESSKDAKLLEVYIKSNHIYTLLDQAFNLTAYYKSDAIDILNRLSDSFLLPMFEESRVNFLNKYREDLTIIFDEASGTLEIAFAHSNPTIAKDVVETIVRFSGERLNYFDRKSSEVILKFLKEQEREKYGIFLGSLKKLLRYQSNHNTISPKVEVEAKSAILSQLEGELVQHEVKYNSKLQYMNESVAEMRLLRNTMMNIRKRIKNLKREIVGKKEGENLHENVSDFELLNSEVEFNKQVYMQILARLEETTALVNQKSKNLIVVSEAEVSDSYDYPKKLYDVISLLIVSILVYGIVGFVIRLIADHKD